MRKIKETDEYFKTLSEEYVVDLDIDADLEYLESQKERYIKRGRSKKLKKLL